MNRRLVSYFVAALITAALTAVFQPFPQLPTLAQSGCQAFKQTGYKVCGRFLAYWQTHGALAQQGYPISNEFQEVSDLDSNAYTVQYFERAVFELHPEKKPPYDVLLSQLGTFRLKEKYPDGPPNNAPAPIPSNTGAIEGIVGYPASGVPDMDVYAKELTGGLGNEHTYSTHVATLGVGEVLPFHIDGIAPGIYNVVALASSPMYQQIGCGGYSQFVVCGLGQTCFDHSLVPIVVRAGETVKNIEITDWYSNRNLCPWLKP